MLMATMTQAGVTFSDDFTGADGTLPDAAKWTVSASNVTATIQGNTAVLASNGTAWANGAITTTTGADFFANGAEVIYSVKLVDAEGTYTSGYFEVADAVMVNWRRESGTMVLFVVNPATGSYDWSSPVWTGTADFWDNPVSITLTPTTYTVNLKNATTVSGSLSGLHGLSAGSYTSEGKFRIGFTDHLGNANYQCKVDDVKIESYLTRAPVFSPAGPKIVGETTVTISSATAGAKIYYTTDGSRPTAAGTEYSNPTTVTVTNGTILKAIAVGSDTSRVTSQTYAFYERPETIPYGSAIIDGNFSDWSGATWVPLDKLNDLTGTAESLQQDVPEAYYTARWQENKIYVAVKVRDTDPEFTDNYSDWNVRDAIEVFLHTDGTGPVNYSYSANNTLAQQYVFGIKNSNHNAVWATVGTGGVQDLATYPEVAAASGTYDGEWVYCEMAITPYTYFGLMAEGNLSTSVITNLTNTQIIGLDVEVMSNSGGGASGYLGKRSENNLQPKWNNWANFGQHNLSVKVSGDANSDGAVDVGDLGILAANYGGVNKVWAQGDFNGDHAVDVGDLGILAANYGTNTNNTDWSTDYAKAFGTTTTSEDDSEEEITSSVCSGLGLPLIAGLILMGLMLVKLEE
jgi:hypothetical protein